MDIGISTNDCISAKAQATLVSEIRAVGGREVFFAGALDDNGMIVSVRVCARGHEWAVPAILEALDPFESVIHNHPSGVIEPSDEDLDVASICGRQGHGCLIIDNNATRAYVLVEPLRRRENVDLDASELAKAFSPSGRLAQVLPHFEIRPQQVAMMEAVTRAFNKNGIAVVEAPTGVGKTMAYLLPAVLWALRNRDRIVISTRTINLQEQIILKDIPLLQRSIPETINAVLVKGRSNYLCRRRLERALSEATLFDDEGSAESLRAIGEWVEKTQDGSLSDLAFVPVRDVWDRVCSEADSCTGMRCPSIRTCFVNKARREVAKADIIVANHHILFSDIAMKKDAEDFSMAGVLPSYKRVIFDEAHSIEDSATEYFGVQATRLGLLSLLGRFIRVEHGRERGLIPYIAAKLARDMSKANRESLESTESLIYNEVLPGLEAVRNAATLTFDALRDFVIGQSKGIGGEVKLRLTPDVLANPALRVFHANHMLPAAEEISRCAATCARLHAQLKRLIPEDDPFDWPLAVEHAQLAAYTSRLTEMGNVLAESTSAELEPNTVRWVEVAVRNPAYIRLARCPLEVGETLAERVYDKLSAIIMTSATLAVQRSFHYFFTRTGLNHAPADRIETLDLETPFDFENQAVLGIMSDVPSPDDKSFLPECTKRILEALMISKGHAFVLFTSFYALDYTFRELEEELKQHGITPLKQGMAARTRLLDRFRADSSSVLFATDSFWEGVDVAGEALQCVILPKLPFRVPTEPVLEARVEAIEAAGGNAFMTYTVPQAVIKFRQGFGRLIRRKTDRGVILVLDKRVITKYYGRVFVESLPNVRLVIGTHEEVFGALQAFFVTTPDA